MESIKQVDLILLDKKRSGPIEFGVERLIIGLKRTGYSVREITGDSLADAKTCCVVVAGTSEQWKGSHEPLLDRVSSQGISLPCHHEELAIARCKEDDKEIIAIIGGNEVGLMYGLLEVAESIDKGEELFDIPPTSEAPKVPVRGVFTFLHNADLEREWFYSHQFWRDYFGMLAQHRYNSFNLVFSHQTYYLAPLFPFFINVPEHPEVQAIDLTPEERRRNFEMLQYITQLAEERGIDFVLGIWQVSSWKDSVFGGGDQVRTMVQGLDWDNLESYTYHGLRHLLQACPSIKGVQIRANAESGVPEDIQTSFFANSIFRAMKDCGRDVHLDLRCWIARPETLQAAIDMGIPMSLSMKYWAEHQGAPYQAAEQLPAYSYADFLKKPASVPVMYQLWSLGTHRILLWGDPEYARRFAMSMELGNTRGFEINPPLAQKGYGNEPGYWRVLASRDDEYYRWEYERYWFYYLLFGRLAYNPETSPRVWRRELESRFGAKAELVEKAYGFASQIISFMIRYQMNDPNMYSWPEIDTGGILDYYMDTFPSDPAVMDRISEAALQRVTGRQSAKMTPEEASKYMENIGNQCLEVVRELESSAAHHREMASTLLDVGILGSMALYHASKIRAAEHLALYYSTKDYATLKQAHSFIQSASKCWEECVRLADGKYYDHMVTGPIDSGHWKDKLVLVRDDERRVEELIALYEDFGPFDYAFDFGGTPKYRSRENMMFSIHREYHLEKHFLEVNSDTGYTPARGYGWSGGARVRAYAHPPVRISDRDLDVKRRDTGMEYKDNLSGYKNALCDDYVWANVPVSFLVDLPNGLYEVALIVVDSSTNGRDHGPMYAQVNGELLIDGQFIPKGKKVVVKKPVEIRGGRLTLQLWAESGKSWVIAGLVINRAGVELSHVPPVMAGPTEGLPIEITVKETLDSVKALWANVCQCGNDNDFADAGLSSATRVPLSIKAPYVYSGIIPQELLVDGGELVYSFEAEGVSGNRYDLGSEEPFRVPVIAGEDSDIQIEHQPVHEAVWGSDIAVRCRIASRHPLKHARLHYRHVNQYHSFRVATMELVDATQGVYEATIPGCYHDAAWDLMYYLEIVDEAGNGTFYPNPQKETPYIVIREK